MSDKQDTDRDLGRAIEKRDLYHQRWQDAAERLRAAETMLKCTGPTDAPSVESPYEREWYRSKKFWAFLIVEIIMTAMGATTLAALILEPRLGWPVATPLLAIIVTQGVVGLTYFGKQAALDQYVRAISLLGERPAAPLPPLDDVIDEMAGEDGTR